MTSSTCQETSTSVAGFMTCRLLDTAARPSTRRPADAKLPLPVACPGWHATIVRPHAATCKLRRMQLTLTYSHKRLRPDFDATLRTKATTGGVMEWVIPTARVFATPEFAHGNSAGSCPLHVRGPNP